MSDCRGRSGRGVGVALAVVVRVMLLAAPVTAQSRIVTEVDSTRATVGDRITMTVSVEAPEGASVEWPDSLDLAPFEVLDMRAGPASAVLTLAAFELGELEIPSFDVVVVGPDGGRETLRTDAWGVEMVSVGVDESGDIRDIRGPLAIPLGALRLLAVLLGPLLVIVLLYLLARRLRSRTEDSGPGGLPQLERPAHEIALEELAALEASDLLARGLVKEFHIEVSDILRAYVERRFRVGALEMTSREVLEGLDRAGVDASFREGLGAFLDQCDLVKFAKVRPGSDVSLQALQLGRRLVQRSAGRGRSGGTVPFDEASTGGPDGPEATIPAETTAAVGEEG